MRSAIVLAASLFLSSALFAAHATTLAVWLDYLPNPNHVPLFAALESGRFAARGLDVDFVVPSSVSDPAKLAAARVADVALTPQINYLIARAEGLPLVAVGVYIDQSLGGLLALSDSGVRDLADLARRPIGYSLAPLEPVLWRAMLSCVGVPEEDVDLISIGYSTTAALLDGSVAAIGAFRNVEAVLPEVEARGPLFFPQEAFCIPPTYDLVFVAHPDVVAERAADLASFLEVVEESVAATREAPDASFAAFARLYPELDDAFDRRSFAATLPLYAESVRLRDPSAWQAVQEFLVEAGLVAHPTPFESLVVDLALSTP